MSLSNEISMLEHTPDAVKNVRKYFDLDKPGKMEEAVSILEDWIKMQKHFKKKDFNRHFLEMMIIQSKGSLERAKNRLDQYCTLRTLMPKFFDVNNPKTDCMDAHKTVCGGILHQFVQDYYRVGLFKIVNKNITSKAFLEYYKFTLTVLDYILATDYFNGILIVLDYMEVNTGDVLLAANPIDLNEVARLYTECLGLRIKGIHIVTTPSTIVNGLVKLLRQVLSPKIGGRVHVHKNFDCLFEFLPREAFPEEYGGNEKPLKKLQDEWLDFATSEQCMKHIQEMKKATVDEELRDKYEFNSKYMGLPGTFRSLSLD